MLYEVDEQFLEELQKAEEENLLPSGDDDITEEEVKERIKKRSYVMANKAAELKALDDLEKEIKQKKNTIKNTIEFLKQADEKDVYFLYGDDIDKAKKETKGYLNFRKSNIVNIPDEVSTELISNDVKLEKVDTETGEIVDVTENYLTSEVVRKINKTELKKVLDSSTVTAVTKDGNEYEITLKENVNLNVPKVII